MNEQRLLDELTALNNANREHVRNFDDEVINYFKEKAEKAGIAFKYKQTNDSLIIYFGDNSVNIGKRYVGGTTGHSDGTFNLSISEDEANQEWFQDFIRDNRSVSNLIKKK